MLYIVCIYDVSAVSIFLYSYDGIATSEAQSVGHDWNFRQISRPLGKHTEGIQLSQYSIGKLLILLSSIVLSAVIFYCCCSFFACTSRLLCALPFFCRRNRVFVVWASMRFDKTSPHKKPLKSDFYLFFIFLCDYLNDYLPWLLVFALYFSIQLLVWQSFFSKFSKYISVSACTRASPF